MLSINLISPTEKSSIKSMQNFSLFKHVYYLLIYFIIFISIIFVFSYLILSSFDSSLQNSLDKEIASRQSGQTTSMNDIIIKLNFQLSQIVTLQSKFINWPKAIITLANDLPNGVNLSSLEMDRESKTFKISGTASTRESFLALQSYLNTNTFFKEIVYPSINIAQKTDMPFEISGKLTDTLYGL